MNEIICQFCDKPLILIGGNWKECKYCQVSYYQGEYRGLHIKWERQIGDWGVALNLYPDVNKTVLVAHNNKLLLDIPPKDYNFTEIKLNHCMTNITPNNCLDKMKLLLVWQ